MLWKVSGSRLSGCLTIVTLATPNAWLVDAGHAALLTTVPSLAYVYHAKEDPDGTSDGKWNASETYHGYANSDLTLNGGPTYIAATGSAHAPLSEAFRFSAAANASQAASALLTYGNMSRTGSTNRDSMTWEMWVKPTATTNADLDGRYLFAGTSGNSNRGVWLKFKENVGLSTVDIHLFIKRDSGGASASWTLDATDANTNGLIDILENDFVQITAMYDHGDRVRSANNYAYLSVNGAAAVTNSDTTGNDAVKFNGQLGWATFSNNPTPPAAFATTTNTGFAGDIALIRVYDTALTDAQLAEAYSVIVPEPSTLGWAGLGLLTLLLGGRISRRRQPLAGDSLSPAGRAAGNDSPPGERFS